MGELVNKEFVVEIHIVAETELFVKMAFVDWKLIMMDQLQMLGLFYSYF